MHLLIDSFVGWGFGSGSCLHWNRKELKRKQRWGSGSSCQPQKAPCPFVTLSCLPGLEQLWRSDEKLQLVNMPAERVAFGSSCSCGARPPIYFKSEDQNKSPWNVYWFGSLGRYLPFSGCPAPPAQLSTLPTSSVSVQLCLVISKPVVCWVF